MLAYVNAKAKILEYIKVNHLKAGDRLPTELDLAEQLGIGRLSLREGLNALKTEGIVQSVQGKGTFVACSSDHISDTLNVNYSVTDMIRSSGYKPGASCFQKNIVRANDTVAKALKIQSGIDIPLCTRVRTADGEPVVLTKDYLAPVLATAFLGLSAEHMSLYNYIEESSEIRIGTSITEIVPMCATEELANVLGIQQGTPILALYATVNDIYGVPLIYATEYFRADKFKFLVARGRQ